jgi:hypothetical protein
VGPEPSLVWVCSPLAVAQAHVLGRGRVAQPGRAGGVGSMSQ